MPPPRTSGPLHLLISALHTKADEIAAHHDREREFDRAEAGRWSAMEVVSGGREVERWFTVPGRDGVRS